MSVQCSPALHLDKLLTCWNSFLLLRLFFCKKWRLVQQPGQFISPGHVSTHSPVTLKPRRGSMIPSCAVSRGQSPLKFIIKKIKSNNKKPVRTSCCATVWVVQVVRPSTAEGGAIWVQPVRSSTPVLGINWRNMKKSQRREKSTSLSASVTVIVLIIYLNLQCGSFVSLLWHFSFSTISTI